METWCILIRSHGSKKISFSLARIYIVSAKNAMFECVQESVELKTNSAYFLYMCWFVKFWTTF